MTRHLWRRAAWRWLAVTAVLFVLACLYNAHPFYAGTTFAPWRPLFAIACAVWVVLGLPYSYFTMRRFSSRANDLREPALHWMLLARGIVLRRRVRHVIKNPRVGVTLRSLVVKAFYLPLITSFLAGHVQNIVAAWAERHHQPVFTVTTYAGWIAYVKDVVPALVPHASDAGALFHLSWWTSAANVHFAADAYYNVIFVVDCGAALLGYGLESRWLGNKTRSVETSALGWAAALACYPPFNDVLGTFLPMGGQHVWMSSSGQLACRVISLAMFTVYAWATVSFGLKFSNLTNRGVIERGPYRFIRHPAYVCKSIAWWLESLPSLTPTTAFFLTLLNGVYALRAWTEERHLSKDPSYRAYRARVRWVAIPGIV